MGEYYGLDLSRPAWTPHKKQYNDGYTWFVYLAAVKEQDGGCHVTG